MSGPEAADVEEMSKQGYFTILLDEQLRGLKPALEDDGFKVVMPAPGLPDDAIMELARGWAILTRNSADFEDGAVRFDYDIIAIEGIRFIDDRRDRTNETVKKISGAVRRSRIAARKGNFLLEVRDSGAYFLRQLV